MNLFGPGILTSLGVILGVYVLMPLFPFLYVVLRWRTQGEGEPGAGSLGALLYFRNVSLLVMLSAVSLLIYGMLSTTGDQEEVRRASWGSLAGGGFFFGVNLFLGIRFGRAPAHHPVRRIFSGFLLVISGLVALVVTIAFAIVLFQKVGEFGQEDHNDLLKFLGSWTFVWLLTYLATLGHLVRGAAAASEA